ncbi:MAG: DUF1353 domain-containing protein [Gammaproteobacteria bacterium]|nr:DUF1353 domain-containing protein [Gammaproteobacteria bacterium]
MRAEVIEPLIVKPVPRDTHAPWLDPKANKVELVEDFVVLLKVNAWEHYIVVPKGYVSDWSSIPRAVWWIYPPNFSEARHGSIVHDYIYSHLYRKFSKDFADKALKACMSMDGASRFAQTVFYNAVKVGGSGGWTLMNRDDVHPHWKEQHEFIRYKHNKPFYTS